MRSMPAFSSSSFAERASIFSVYASMVPLISGIWSFRYAACASKPARVRFREIRLDLIRNQFLVFLYSNAFALAAASTMGVLYRKLEISRLLK